jgi:hypothetical protein
MRRISTIASCLTLAACATTSGGPPVNASLPLDQMRAKMPHSSPECLASKLRPADPFPASAIPPDAMAKRQSGFVAIRYDVADGVAQNLELVGSSPPGLYDAAAMQHAARYRDPGRTTVRGCVMIIDVKF